MTEYPNLSRDNNSGSNDQRFRLLLISGWTFVGNTSFMPLDALDLYPYLPETNLIAIAKLPFYRTVPIRKSGKSAHACKRSEQLSAFLGQCNASSTVLYVPINRDDDGMPNGYANGHGYEMNPSRKSPRNVIK